MKILFVDGQHLPKPDANSNCVQKLREQLHKFSINSDVLTFGFGDKDLLDEYGKIYVVNLLMKEKIGELGFNILNHISGGRYVWEKRYSELVCLPMKKKLEKLCEKEHYDWVISTAFPFCIHLVSTSANLNGAKVALYNLDPYAFNKALPMINQEKRLKEECEVYEKADVIITSLEHYVDWKDTELSCYLNKVKFIPYPNLGPYEGNYEYPIYEKKDNWRDILYIGALHDQVRQPKAMLELFKNMLLLDEQYRLIIVGNRSGEQVEQQINQAQEKLGEHLLVMGAIPFPQAMGLIQKADAVFNLGNQMKNQMPSKVLDYIAAGKTIINISYNKPCNTEAYLQKYGRAVQLYEREITSDYKNASQKVLTELKKYDANMEWELVKVRMNGLTAEDVAKEFLNALIEDKKR